MINREEIERVLDDFQTKASQAHEEAKEIYKTTGDYEEVVRLDRQSHAFEYCAAVLRQLLPNG